MRFQFPRCLIGKSGFRFECREKYPWISFLSVLLGNPKKDLKLGSSFIIQITSNTSSHGKYGSSRRIKRNRRSKARPTGTCIPPKKLSKKQRPE